MRGKRLFKNLVGTVFNNLILKIHIYDSETKQNKYICECLGCGYETKPISTGDLNCRFKNKKYGCGGKGPKGFNPDMCIFSSQGKYKDVIGKEFNGIIVLRRISPPNWTKRKQPLSWVDCKCHCGKIFQANARDIRTGNTKSCGCEKYHFGESHHNYKDGRSEDSRRRILLKLNKQNKLDGRSELSLVEFAIKYPIPETCPIFGITLTELGKGRATDNTPSFDKIDSNGKYVEGNVMWVSMRYNQIKNNGTAEEHRKIADFMDSVASK